MQLFRTIFILTLFMSIFCISFTQTEMSAMAQYKRGIEMYIENTIARTSISGDTVSLSLRLHGRKMCIISVADTIEIYDTRIVYKLKDGAVLRRYFDDGHIIYTNEHAGVHNMEDLLIIMRPDSINSEP